MLSSVLATLCADNFDGASVERWRRFGEVWSHFWAFLAALSEQRQSSNNLGAFHPLNVGTIHDQWMKLIGVFQ